MQTKQYEFTTGSTESTKLLDFSTHFTEANKPFLVQLYKDVAENYQVVNVGLSSPSAMTNSGDGLELFNVQISVNESENKFTLTELIPETTYKLVVVQL